MPARASRPAHGGSGRRLAFAVAGLALALGALPAVIGALPGGPAASAGDDLTASVDNSRTGWDPNEPLLSPAAVRTFTTAPRVDVRVTGPVFAQPLVIHPLNEVVVATENDQVYGITAAGPGAGNVEWSTSLGSPYHIAGDPAFRKCTGLVPNIGVTGTPAYDPGSGNVYLFADILTGGKPAYYLVAVNATTGAYTPADNILISGHPSNDAHLTFSARYQLQEPGVLLAGDGSIWAAFGSHCDTQPATGYVARVSPGSNSPVSLWADGNALTIQQAGTWQSGGGVLQDPQDNIFVTSGNGVSAARASRPPGRLAGSVIRLAYDGGTNHIAAAGFFSPGNAPPPDAAGTGFGSGGPVALPFGTSGYPDILAAPGNDGRIWLLNPNTLGGREQGTGNGDHALSVITSYGGDGSHPAVFAGTTTLTASNASTANNFLFYVGRDASMQVFRFGVDSSGKPTMSNVANSTLTYGYTSGSPVVTSAGTGPGSVVVWVVQTTNTPGTTGAGSYLTAYALGNVAAHGTTRSPCTSSAQCSLTPIWMSQKFTSATFTTPATSDGWVYIGTRDGQLLGYTTATTTAPVLGSTVNLGQAALGASSTGEVTITAHHPVTITGVTASTDGSNAPVPGNQFTTDGSLYLNGGTGAVPLPVNLVPGDRLTAYVRFTPAAAGGAGGTVSFATSSSADPSVNVAVVGTGSQPGLTPSSGTIQFVSAPGQGVTPVAVGSTVPQTVTFTNFGTGAVAVTSVAPPAAPFSASNLPHIGTVIRPGSSISVTLSYRPTAGAPATGSLTIGTTSGPFATVQLAGAGAYPRPAGSRQPARR